MKLSLKAVSVFRCKLEGSPEICRKICKQQKNWAWSEVKTQAAIMPLPGVIPANGLLYISNEDSVDKLGTVCLSNSAKLPVTVAEGFIVATDDALYVQGHYDVTNKLLATIALDILTILSNDLSFVRFVRWIDRPEGNSHAGYFVEVLVGRGHRYREFGHDDSLL